MMANPANEGKDPGGAARMDLDIVVPCYNEQDVIPITAQRLSALLEGLHRQGKIGVSSRIYFVDDGSKDGTWSLIETLAATNHNIHGVKLSHNRGHQSALLAGLLHARGDCVVSIDADLQDDERVIEQMIDRCCEGFDIVYGVRTDRSADTPFKRLTAAGYYELMSWLGVDLVFNHADFRLMRRNAIEALRGYGEVNLFLRGIIPQLGFRTTSVTYRRAERLAGESKYPLFKMLALAVEGIASFSALPLRIITAVGLLISLLSLGLSIWALTVKLFGTTALPGWASTVVPMYFLGGIQLLSLGVIGEYVAKTYIETKRRPRYIIEKTT
jgi:glycosyltransferase involved in cell wall biosynthesis